VSGRASGGRAVPRGRHVTPSGVEDEPHELAAFEREWLCVCRLVGFRATGGEVVLEINGVTDEAIAATQRMFGSLRTTVVQNLNEC
jgi:hypothetical protein